MDKQQKVKNRTQELLFNRINSLLPRHILQADKISELLNISTDAAYRRIRCQKKLSINEICTLCTHFKLSFDELLNHQSNHVSFNYHPIKMDEPDNFQAYLEMLAGNLQGYEKAKEKEMFFLAAGIPLVHLVEPNDLTIFKIFTWANSIYNYKGNFETFYRQMNNNRVANYCRQIATYYKQIPSTEIWNTSSFDSMLYLIAYYYDTGFLKSKKTALKLCEQLIGLTNKLKELTEAGTKSTNGKNSSLKFYICEVALGNNFLLINIDNRKACYIRLFSTNGMITHDPVFCEETEKWVNNILRKSVLISGSSQKERHVFFKTLQQNVERLIDRLR